MTTFAQERAYTAGWRAFVHGLTCLAVEGGHRGLEAFVRRGFNDAHRASKTRNVWWSKRHPRQQSEGAQ